MAAFTIVKAILKAQNAELLRNIAAKYELDEDELLSKYLRPTFFLPDITDAPAIISYSCKELKTTRKKSKTDDNGRREELPTAPSKDPS